MEIAQEYCPALVDHPAHTGGELKRTGPRPWDVRYSLSHCPGRFTPTGFLTDQPIAHPMDSDPFSCIPGAYED